MRQAKFYLWVGQVVFYRGIAVFAPLNDLHHLDMSKLILKGFKTPIENYISIYIINHVHKLVTARILKCDDKFMCIINCQWKIYMCIQHLKWRPPVSFTLRHLGRNNKISTIKKKKIRKSVFKKGTILIANHKELLLFEQGCMYP